MFSAVGELVHLVAGLLPESGLVRDFVSASRSGWQRRDQLRARQCLESAGRIFIAGQSSLAVILKPVFLVFRVSQREQQSGGTGGQLNSFVVGTRDAGQIARPIDAECVALSEWADNCRGFARAVTLDGCDIAIRVSDCRQQPLAVVAELVEHGTSQRVQRPQMFAFGAEVINLAAITRSNHDIGESLVGQRACDFADAVGIGIGDVKVAVRADGHSGWAVEEGLTRRIAIVAVPGVGLAGCRVDPPLVDRCSARGAPS